MERKGGKGAKPAEVLSLRIDSVPSAHRLCCIFNKHDALLLAPCGDFRQVVRHTCVMHDDDDFDPRLVDGLDFFKSHVRTIRR